MNHFLFALVTFFVALPIPSPAEVRNCFADHLSDAIAQNKTRLNQYRRISGGRSIKVSLAMIASEEMSLPGAWVVGIEARKFQRAGVPVLCDDFVSMTRVPPFQSRVEAPTESFNDAIPLSDWKTALREFYRRGDFDGLHREADDIMRQLEGQPHYHCMVRHIVESVSRIAYLAPQYDRMAARARLRQVPSRLEWDLVWAHLKILSLSNELDRMAAPLQAQGIPIICGDVPEIETNPLVD